MLITIEGIDGSGKTSLCRELTSSLRKDFFPQHQVVNWSVPGGANGTMLGDRIRQILLDVKGLTEASKALLLAAEHHNLYILFKVTSTSTDFVLTDRSHYSMFAYQGASGLDADWLKSILGPVSSSIPDLFVLLDVSPAVATRRCENRIGGRDSIEQGYKIAYLEQVRQNYLRITAELPPEKVIVLDTESLSPLEMVNITRQKIQDLRDLGSD